MEIKKVTVENLITELQEKVEKIGHKVKQKEKEDERKDKKIRR